MGIRLRQIAVVAADLGRTAVDVGMTLGLEACHTDPGVAHFGLKNTLWPIGSQFLEVVTPTEVETTAGRYWDRRGGDSGYMVILQVDDLDRHRRRLDELDIRTVFEAKAEGGQRGLQLHPADTGGSLLELDEVPGDDDAWAWAGPRWTTFVRRERVEAITAAELQSPEPDGLAARWSAILERQATLDDDGHTSIGLDNATLRFVEDRDGRGEGLGAIDLAVNDRDAVRAGANARGRGMADDEIFLAGLRMHLR